MPLEMDFQESVNPVCGTEEGQIGAAQRLRIRVPNVYTQLSLGQSLEDQDSQGFAYAGFGVETDAHVFISAGRADGVQDATTNQMRIQSFGQMSLQSIDASVNIGGHKGTMVGSHAGVTVAGGGGIMLAGGTPGLLTDWGSMDQGGTSDNPRTPQWLNDVGSVASYWGNFMALIDVAAGVLGILNDKRSSMAKVPEPPSSRWATFATHAGHVGMGLSAFGAVNVNGWTQDVGNYFGGTTIFGFAGLVAGSPATVGLYSGLGTCIASPASVSILSGFANVDARKTLSMSGEDVFVKAASSTYVAAAKEVTVASRTDLVELLGANVKIGSQAADSDLGQQPTTQMSLAADGQIELVGKEVNAKAGGGRLVLNPNETQLLGKTVDIQATGDLATFASGSAWMMAGQEVKMGVGGQKVVVDSSSVTLSCGGGSATEPKPGKADLSEARARKLEKRKKKHYTQKDVSDAGYMKSIASWNADGPAEIKLEKGKITLQVQQNKLVAQAGKFKSGPLVWKK